MIIRTLDIATDLDGVLVDLIGAFNAVYESTLEQPAPPRERITQFDFRDIYGIDDTVMWRLFHTAFRTPALWHPKPGARAFIEALFAVCGEAPAIITARPLERAGDTCQLVRRLFAPTPAAVTVVGRRASKLPYLNRFSYFVEDRRRNAIEVAETGRVCFLVREPWNAGVRHDRVIYIDSLEELVPLAPMFVREIHIDASETKPCPKAA